MGKAFGIDELQKLPALVSIPAAGKAAFGWEAARSYEEANKGPDGFLPTINTSDHRRRVLTGAMLAKLGLTYTGPGAAPHSTSGTTEGQV